MLQILKKLFLYLFRLLWLARNFTMGNVFIKEKPPYNFKKLTYKLVKSNVSSERVPAARSGHRIVCDSSNLFSFGGYNPADNNNYLYDDDITDMSFPLFQELWKFNFATRTWTLCPSRHSIPEELASSSVILLGNTLIIHGGTGSPFGAKCSNKLYMCDINDPTGEMTLMLTTGQPPPPQYGQSLVYCDGYLYSIGGTTGYHYTCDIYRLNLKEQKWEPVYIFNGRGENEPPGRYRHEAAFYKNNIFILGGGTATEVFDLEEIPTFNLLNKTWTVNITHPDPALADKDDDHPKIPSPRKCHGSVQVDHPSGPKVYISGGYDGDNVYNDMWCLDLKTFQWSFIWTCVLPEPTYFQAAAITPQGQMYQFGGIVEKNECTRTNSIYSTWLCIPKLSEMCWDAILHYNPEIVNNKSEKLLEAGIPRSLVDRIQWPAR